VRIKVQAVNIAKESMSYVSICGRIANFVKKGLENEIIQYTTESGRGPLEDWASSGNERTADPEPR
jgi:hypothetical protein